MKFKYTLLIAAFVLMFCSPFIDGNVWLFALQQPKSQQLKTQPQTQAQTPLEVLDTQKVEPSQTKSPNLAKEIRSLAKEIRQLNAQQRQILDLIFLKLEQERVDKVSDKVMAVESQLRILATKERVLEFKLKNIDNEMLTRNFINRSDAERVIKAEIEEEKSQIKEEKQRLELEKQRLSEDLTNGNRQLDIIRTRLAVGLGDGSKTNKELLEYLQEQDILNPIEEQDPMSIRKE